ncbi:hypothetical protein P7C73_g539, partial [Tremellales sp. Uapishka_1]
MRFTRQPGPSSRRIIFVAISSLCTAAQTIMATPPPYNVTISDESGAITYAPSRSGDSSVTWNVSYSQSSWADYVEQSFGVGNSSHYTTSLGATASVGFIGYAVYFWGSASSGSASLMADSITSGIISTADDGLLGMVENLDYGWHEAQLSVTGGEGVNLTGVTITMGAGLGNGETSVTTLEAYQDGHISSGLQTDASWNALTSTTPQTPNTTFERLDSNKLGASITFQAPQNTSIVVLYGDVNYDHGSYSVSYSPVADDTPTPEIQNFEDTGPWLAVEVVLYYAKVQPGFLYTFNLTNTASAYLAFSRAVFVISTGEPGETETSSATIATLPSSASSQNVVMPSSISESSSTPSTHVARTTPSFASNPPTSMPTAKDTDLSTQISSDHQKVVIGATVGSTAIALLLFGLLFWRYKGRRQWRSRKLFRKLSDRESVSVASWTRDNSRRASDPDTATPGSGQSWGEPNAAISINTVHTAEPLLRLIFRSFGRLCKVSLEAIDVSPHPMVSGHSDFSFSYECDHKIEHLDIDYWRDRCGAR